MIARFKFFDREIVDANEFRALVAEQCRGLEIQVSKICMKRWWYLAPKRGIARLEEHTLGSRWNVRDDQRSIDHFLVLRHFHDKCFTDQGFKRQPFDLFPAFNEMRRGIDVRSGVRPEVHYGNVRAITLCKAAPVVDLNSRIARISGQII